MRTLGTHQPMTYAALEQTLVRFGFIKIELMEPRAFFFEHPTAQATVILPFGTPEEVVQPLDLLTARRTVLEKGIASLEKYTSAVSLAVRSTSRTDRRKRPAQSSKLSPDSTIPTI